MRARSRSFAAVFALGLSALAGGCDSTAPPAQRRTPAYSLALVTEPAAPSAGSPVTLLLSIRDESGSRVSTLRIVHEKPIHLIVVSQDLSFFEHIHPELRADGAFAVETRFPAGGDYDLYASYAPFDAPEQLAHMHCAVAGPARPAVPLVVTTGAQRGATLAVSYEPDARLVSGRVATLRFRADDAGSGKLATDLEPYLGAAAHFVAISDDRSEFLHVHPDSAVDTFPYIVARAVFPKPGLYKLWAQFQRRGAVETASFVVSVDAGPAAEEVVALETEGVQEAHVRVSAEGFSPSRIVLRRDVPARIVFLRADADNCADEVLVPGASVGVDLPIGTPVVVGFTPTSEGELAFTCGMRMYRGTLRVVSP